MFTSRLLSLFLCGHRLMRLTHKGVFFSSTGRGIKEAQRKGRERETAFSDRPIDRIFKASEGRQGNRSKRKRNVPHLCSSTLEDLNIRHKQKQSTHSRSSPERLCKSRVVSVCFGTLPLSLSVSATANRIVIIITNIVAPFPCYKELAAIYHTLVGVFSRGLNV